MAKRIEPLSSRAQRVDQTSKPASKEADADNVAPVTTLPAPRRIDGPKRPANTGSVKKKRSFWRKLWLTIQIGSVMAIILGCVLGYFVYEKALVYYARAETFDLKKLDDLNVTSTFYDVNGEELGFRVDGVKA